MAFEIVGLGICDLGILGCGESGLGGLVAWGFVI